MTDFILTKDQLSQMISNDYVDQWYTALADILPNYEIITSKRIAAFISQCAHESNDFKNLKENLNYRAESLMRVWPSHFPTVEIANQYAHNQEAIANRAYADRIGNGPESSGDGYRYCGRGLIQITGKNNYLNFGNSIGIKLEDVSKYIVTFEGAVRSACWYWKTRDINTDADKEDIITVTKKINGGLLGLDDRQLRYNKAINILGAS